MRFEGLTLGRGLLRAYLVLWLLWALFFAFSSHKALLTAIGVTYWTPESVMERSRLEHEAEYKEIDCDNATKEFNKKCFELHVLMTSIPLGSFVTQEDAKSASRIFLHAAIVIPLLIFFAGSFMWFLLTWVISGFVGSNKK